MKLAITLLVVSFFALTFAQANIQTAQTFPLDEYEKMADLYIAGECDAGETKGRFYFRNLKHHISWAHLPSDTSAGRYTDIDTKETYYFFGTEKDLSKMVEVSEQTWFGYIEKDAINLYRFLKKDVEEEHDCRITKREYFKDR